MLLPIPPLAVPSSSQPKSLTLLTTCYLPILLSSLLLYATWTPNLPLAKPNLFFTSFLIAQLHYLHLALTTIALTPPIAIISPKQA